MGGKAADGAETAGARRTATAAAAAATVGGGGDEASVAAVGQARAGWQREILDPGRVGFGRSRAREG